MSKYVRPNDFEDMMRPLAKAAMNQGWLLHWTANGHVKWIPKKGPCVITSVTNAAFKPNVVKLREGGLVIPHDEQNKAEEKIDIQKLNVIETPTPPTPIVPKERKKMMPRGSVQNAVIDFFAKHGTAGMTYNLDDVMTHVRGVLPGVSREVISTTCSQNAAAGKLVRMGKGQYRYANMDRRADDKDHITKEEQEMLADDEKVLNNFMNALAELQDWAAKMRKMSMQFNRMKKMLDGMKMQ